MYIILLFFLIFFEFQASFFLKIAFENHEIYGFFSKTLSKRKNTNLEIYIDS
jgi:hypothetical protein